MVSPKKDPMGKVVLGVFAVIVAVFIALAVYIATLRGRVSEKVLETRHQIALQLSKRNWPTGDSHGKLVDGHIDESVLPAPLADSASQKEVESFSDAFKTYTVYEFESEKDKQRLSIQIGTDFYKVHK